MDGWRHDHKHLGRDLFVEKWVSDEGNQSGTECQQMEQHSKDTWNLLAETPSALWGEAPVTLKIALSSW